MKTPPAIKSLAKTLGDPVFWALSSAELSALLTRFPDNAGGDILTMTKEYRGRGWYKRIRSLQVEEEFRRLADWAASQTPRIVIEIGTASGGTLLMWARIATERVISIDLPGGIHGGGYPEQKARLFKAFVRGRPNVTINLIRANSHEQTTRDRVGGLLGPARADILFIDGDHRLEGVTRDFELWRDLERPGGHIVFHDVLYHPRTPSAQVDQLWNDLKKRHHGRTQEIIESPDQGWAGIGILEV